MELKQKGQEAYIAVKQLLISMKWTTAADFDLAAAYETKTGVLGLVYFGNLGDMNAFPFINLSKDQGVSDSGGHNEETMRIMKLDDMQYVWVFCWDYTRIQAGQAARFKESDVVLTITDDSGKTVTVKIDTGDMGNVCCIAMIDNSSPLGAKLINMNKVAILKELHNSDQLLKIVKG